MAGGGDLRHLLNCWHQHFNGSGREPARDRGVTNASLMMNLYDDVNYIFNTKWDFTNRFAGELDDFSSKGEQKGFLLTSNLVPDAVRIPLDSGEERGAGGWHICFNMARGSMSSHISQFPVGTYKKAHCHGPSAHVIILSGEGDPLMWPENGEPERYYWEVGTLIVPPNKTYHQHFNTGPTSARYLAFKHESALIRNHQGVPTAWISKRVGGDQIDYADERPDIRNDFEKALSKHGIASKMETVYEAEKVDSPPRLRDRRRRPTTTTGGAPLSGAA